MSQGPNSVLFEMYVEAIQVMVRSLKKGVFYAADDDDLVDIDTTEVVMETAAMFIQKLVQLIHEMEVEISTLQDQRNSAHEDLDRALTVALDQITVFEGKLAGGPHVR